MTDRMLWSHGPLKWLLVCLTVLTLNVQRSTQTYGVERFEDAPPERFEFTETHMGSPVLLVLYTKDADVAKKTAELAYQRMAQLDRIFSDYNNNSELMLLVNVFATERAAPQEVSDDLFMILSRSAQISEQTHGAFDVTAAPVIRQWRRARRDRKMPTQKNLADALSKVGYRRVRLIPEKSQVQLEPGTRIDLGGIAKGFAAVEMLKIVKSAGVTSALVSVAGDIAVGEAPPGRNGWRVEVAGLNPTKDKPLAVLELTNAAISTSGDAERFVEIDGRRFSHIVDPKTGLGVERRATVTVISKLDQSADAYATSLYLLGVQDENLLGKLKNPPDLAVIWLEETAQGQRHLKTNAAFEKIHKSRQVK